MTALTPLEYTLNLVAEECAEVIQAISKIHRFGFYSAYRFAGEVHDGTHRNNHRQLQDEITDLMACLQQLNLELHRVAERPFTRNDEEAIQVKLEKIRRYAERSVQLGTLQQSLVGTVNSTDSALSSGTTLSHGK